jgi:hypothetical protein
MLGFLWSIFCLIFFIAFIFFFFKVFTLGMKQLSYKQRILASPPLLIGVLSLFAALASTNQQTTSITPLDGYITKVKSIPYSKTNDLYVFYFTHRETGEILPHKSEAYLGGFTLGRRWNHFGVNQKEDSLQVTGSMIYSIMGLKFFSPVSEPLMVAIEE